MPSNVTIRKKLIEVALPLVAINVEAGAPKEKSSGRIPNLSA